MNIEEVYGTENERPLDRLVSDGGFTGVFRNIACIGDSLSSGEFEAMNAEGKKTYHDMFDYSWGQYLARMAGSTAYNISRGGMTCKEFLDSFGPSKNYLDVCKNCEAVIIALGVNDVSFVLNNKYEFGFDPEKSDEENFAEGKNDVAGWYAQLMRNIIAVNPYAHFFLVTAPHSEEKPDREAYYDLHQQMLIRLTAFFARTYVIDLRAYAPVYDARFKRQFYMSGHLNPAGYLFTAKLFASYIDFIVRHNPQQFCQLGFTHNEIINPDYFK